MQVTRVNNEEVQFSGLSAASVVWHKYENACCCVRLCSTLYYSCTGYTTSEEEALPLVVAHEGSRFADEFNTYYETIQQRNITIPADSTSSDHDVESSGNSCSRASDAECLAFYTEEAPCEVDHESITSLGTTGEEESNQFPDLLIKKIYTYLDLPDRINLSMTCKKWNKLSYDKALIPAALVRYHYPSPETCLECLPRKNLAIFNEGQFDRIWKERFDRFSINSTLVGQARQDILLQKILARMIGSKGNGVLKTNSIRVNGYYNSVEQLSGSYFVAIKDKKTILVREITNEGQREVTSVSINDSKNIFTLVKITDVVFITTHENCLKVWDFSVPKEPVCIASFSIIFRTGQGLGWWNKPIIKKISDEKILIISSGREPQLWDISKPDGEQCIARFDFNITAVAVISPYLLALGDSRGTIFVVRLFSGGDYYIESSFPAHQGTGNNFIKKIKFIRDRKWLLSTTESEIKIWDYNDGLTPDNCLCLHQYDKDTHSINDPLVIRINPNG